MWACHAICKFITFSGYKSLIVMESLCVYVHICCICMQVYVPMCVSTSVPMPWYMCISQRLTSGVFPHLALVWDRVSCFLVHCCVSKLSSPWASGGSPVSTSPVAFGALGGRHMPAYSCLCGVWNSSSAPHICMAGALPMEPSPKPGPRHSESKEQRQQKTVFPKPSAYTKLQLTV